MMLINLYYNTKPGIISFGNKINDKKIIFSIKYLDDLIIIKIRCLLKIANINVIDLIIKYKL